MRFMSLNYWHFQGRWKWSFDETLVGKFAAVPSPSNPKSEGVHEEAWVGVVPYLWMMVVDCVMKTDSNIFFYIFSFELVQRSQCCEDFYLLNSCPCIRNLIPLTLEKKRPPFIFLRIEDCSENLPEHFKVTLK